LDREIRLADRLAGVGEGLGLDPPVQGVQVGGLAGGDGVGGDEQGRDPQQDGQDDDQADAGGGVPHPGVVS
jgi:hypothetical protein